MSSLHGSVRVTSSDPYPASPNVDADRRSIGPEPPSSPRENKRKKFQHEISSPNVFSRNKHGRHSLVIEAPIIPHSPIIAWDGGSNHEMRSKSQTDTCSLNSSSSYESLLEPDEKCLVKIHHIINELISTEKNYIKDLMDILSGYLEPMKDSGMFSEELLQDIFINIREIGSFHVEFLELLDKHQQELDNLANCFLSDSADKGFSLYTEFCAKVPSSLDIVEDLMSVEENKNFLVQCQNSLHHFFQFSEFLHRPIQRVLKYPLLLRDLVKYTSGTRYWRTVDAALDRITAVAVHINKVKRVQELSSNELVGWTGEQLLSYGTLLLEDLFRINGSRDCRHIFLFEKLFLITKKKEGKYHYKTHLCPSEIAMTENLHGEQCKWEVFKFGDKKNKHVIQASDPKKKQAWVREIKRCILESETELSPQQREILLNEVPTLVNNDFMLDDFILQNYQGLIPVCPDDSLESLDQTLVSETSDTNTPERRRSSHMNSPLQTYFSPSNTPSPITRQSPSPDAQHNNDSGFEDPTPKNQVDYSSLDVKAIKARWIMQEKSNTAPSRSRAPLDFHRNSTEKKPETWPCPENKQEVEELRKSNRVSSLKDTFNKTPSPPPLNSFPESSVHSERSEKEDVITKPCLVRISHIGNGKEKKTPVYRDIQSLLDADAASLQQTELKPDSLSEPELEPKTSYDLCSNNKSTIYRNTAIEIDSALKPSSAAEKNIEKNITNIEQSIDQHNYSANINIADKSNKSDELVHSESEEFVVRFRKDCKINGTDTTKRNSTIIDKEFIKDMTLFSPCSSDSEYMSDRSETSARVERIKNAYERSKRKQKKGPKLEKSDTETTLKSDSLTDLIDQFDGEMTKVRTSPEKSEYDEFVNKLSAQDVRLSVSSNASTIGSVDTTDIIDDSTLTKDPATLRKKIDDDTLTKENSSYIYMGSSLIRGKPEDGSEEIVMKPENPRHKEKATRKLSKLQAPVKTSKPTAEARRKSSSRPKVAPHNNTWSSTDDEEQGEIMKPKRSSVTTKTSSRTKITASRKKSDTTDDDVPKTTYKPHKPSQNMKSPTSTLVKSSSKTSTLQKSSSNKSIQKSSSNKSIQKSPSGTQIRDRSGSNTMARPKPTSMTKTPAPATSRYSKPTASSAAKTTTKVPARRSSFNQDDNPFNTKKITSTTKTPAPKSRPKTARSLPQPVTTAEKPRTVRSTSDSAKNRQAAYLNAASKTKSRKPSESGLIKQASDQDIVELNSIRSSALVSKMKTQLQKSNADLKQTSTGRATVKRKYTSRSQTTAINSPRTSVTARRQSKSYSTPPGSRRHSAAAQPTLTRSITKPTCRATTPTRIASPCISPVGSKPSMRPVRRDTMRRSHSPSVCPPPHGPREGSPLCTKAHRVPDPKSKLDSSRATSMQSLPGSSNLSRLPSSLSKSTPGINEVVTRRVRQSIVAPQKRRSVIGMSTSQTNSERSAIPIRCNKNRNESFV